MLKFMELRQKFHADDFLKKNFHGRGGVWRGRVHEFWQMWKGGGGVKTEKIWTSLMNGLIEAKHNEPKFDGFGAVLP